MDTEDFKPLRYRKRWLCYLDLLGFTALINDKNIAQVIPLYKQALGIMEQVASNKKSLGINYSWFSDTFIIYSRGDGEEDFVYVEQTSRLFFQSLILNKIPVCGALTHGALYSQSSQNIFVGPALIDAYYYTEKQDWVGFILTPSVYKRLEKSSIPLPKRTHYRLVDQPGIINYEPSSPVYAFAFNNVSVNENNPYRIALETMKASAPESVKHKYQRAIDFAA